MQSKYSRLSNISVLLFMNPLELARYFLVHIRSYTKFNSARKVLMTKRELNETNPA